MWQDESRLPQNVWSTLNCVLNLSWVCSQLNLELCDEALIPPVIPNQAGMSLVLTLRYICFQFLLFWNSTWQIQSYTHFLSSHPPHFWTKHWHSGAWCKPAGRKRVSSQLWWGWGLAVPGVKQQWKTLFFSVTLNGLPSIQAGGVGLWGQYGGSVHVQGLPSCCHGVCQVQHYHSSGIVWPLCLFCPSEEERSCSPFHLLLVSTQNATLFPHWTSHLSELKRCQHSETNGETDCCLVSNAKQVGPHEPLDTVDIFISNFFLFNHSVNTTNIFICVRPHRENQGSYEWQVLCKIRLNLIFIRGD